MMFSLFSRKKGGSRSKKRNSKGNASKGVSAKQTNTASSGGIVSPTPPVATKKRPRTKDKITTSDVAKIWNNKRRN